MNGLMISVGLFLIFTMGFVCGTLTSKAQPSQKVSSLNKTDPPCGDSVPIDDQKQKTKRQSWIKLDGCGPGVGPSCRIHL